MVLLAIIAGLVFVGTATAVYTMLRRGVISFRRGRGGGPRGVCINPRKLAVELAPHFPEHVRKALRGYAKVAHVDTNELYLIHKYYEFTNFVITPQVDGANMNFIEVHEEQASDGASKQDEDEERTSSGTEGSGLLMGHSHANGSNAAITVPPALRIGKVRVEWDSYIRPCFKLYVTDVQYTLEFTRRPPFMRSNW
jgi:hypothetical protein